MSDHDAIETQRRRPGEREEAKSLRAAGGLEVSVASQLPLRVRIDGEDWLGPVGCELTHRGVAWSASRTSDAEPFGEIRDDLGRWRECVLDTAQAPFAIRASVRACLDAPIVVFRLEALRDLEGLGTGTFANPSVAWPVLAPGLGTAPAGTRTYGHQCSEFAIPVSGAADATGYTLPGHRPPVVWPLLWIATDGRTLLLAPLAHFHEQVVRVPDPAVRVEYVHGEGYGRQARGEAVPSAPPIRAGWHGDLATVPAGFVTEFALLRADGPRAALDAFASILMRRAGTRRPSRTADPFLRQLSYWTDNGAVYYYRPEPAHTIEETLSRVARELPAAGIPIRALQLDSWFYPHETLRAVAAEGAPIVPPTGMLRWEPREDLFPHGFRRLRETTNGLPLAFHSRHFAASSPYFEQNDAFVDGPLAHPVDPDFIDRLIGSVASWGGVTYEQDWLVESFLSVRGLREAPGRARAWQEGMDRAASHHGVTLQWCMGTPADWAQTVTLRNVTSVRTSGDYQYGFDNGLNWVWFLHGNAFARALGLHPFKDVFLSHGPTGHGPGETYVDAESMLSAYSTGPVGIGDRLGYSDREVVLRTCREDGVLVKPDVPIAALDRCFRQNAFLEAVPLLGECHSAHPLGRVIYAVAMNASRTKEPLVIDVPLCEFGVGPSPHGVVLFDWRARTVRHASATDTFACRLDWQEFSVQVIAPVGAAGLALIGDPARWATAGDQRITGLRETASGIAFDVLGGSEERVLLVGWALRPPREVRSWTPGRLRTLAADDLPPGPRSGPDAGWHRDAETGLLTLALRLDDVGRLRVMIDA